MISANSYRAFSKPSSDAQRISILQILTLPISASCLRPLILMSTILDFYSLSRTKLNSFMDCSASLSTCLSGIRLLKSSILYSSSKSWFFRAFLENFYLSLFELFEMLPIFLIIDLLSMISLFNNLNIPGPKIF